MNTWLEEQAGAVVLLIKVLPNAPRSEVCGVLAGALKVKIQAPAVEGRANEALIEYLAGLFSLKVREVQVLSGAKSRVKRVAISGRTAEQISAAILPLCRSGG